MARPKRQKKRAGTRRGKLGLNQVPDGSNYRLLANYPTRSLDAWADALCLDEGEDNQQRVKDFIEDALIARPEFMSWLWGQGHREGAGTTARAVRARAMKTMQPEKDEVRNDNVAPHAYNTPLKMYTRLAYKFHAMLQANKQARQQQCDLAELYEKRDDLPIVMHDYETSMVEESDRYWFLMHRLVTFVAYDARGKGMWRKSRTPARVVEAVERYETSLAAANRTIQVSPGEQRFLRVRLFYCMHSSRIIPLNGDLVGPWVDNYKELCREVKRKFSFGASAWIEDIRYCPPGHAPGPSLHGQDSICQDLMDSCDDGIIEVLVWHGINRAETDENAPTWYPHEDSQLGCYSCKNERIVRSTAWMQHFVQFIKEVHDGSTFNAADAAEPTTELGKLIADARSEEYERLLNLDRLTQDLVSRFGTDAHNARYSDESAILAGLNTIMPNLAETARRLPRTREDEDGKELTVPQLGAVWYQLEQNSARGGGVLADGRGIGKTVEMMAGIRAMHAVDAHRGHRTDKPLAVVVPSTVLDQTMRDFHNELGKEYVVFRYGHGPQQCMDDNPANVTLKHDSIAFRPLRGSRVGRHVMFFRYEDLSKLWDSNLKQYEGLFDSMWLDEGHFARHGVLTKRGHVINAFKARVRWIFTGCPIVNSLEDFRGYVTFLEQTWFYDDAERPYAPRHQRSSSVGVARSVESKLPAHLRPDVEAEEDNDGESPRGNQDPPFRGRDIYHEAEGDPRARALAATTPAWNWWVEPHLRVYMCKGSKEHLAIAIRRMRILWSDMVLYRTHKTKWTRADGTRALLTEGLPPLRYVRPQLCFKVFERPYYEYAADRVGRTINFSFVPGATMVERYPERFLEGDGLGMDEDDPAEPIYETLGASYTMHTKVNTHPGFWSLRHLNTQYWQTKMRGHSLPSLLWLLRRSRACDLHQRPEPFRSDLMILSQFLHCSPKLRQMSIDVVETVLSQPDDGRNKVIVYTQSPQTAEWVNKLLNFLGVGNLLLSTTQSPADRYTRIRESFNSDSNHIQALVCTFSLRMVGMNLDRRCRTVICLEQPFNSPRLLQAVDHVRRKTQTSEQVVKLYCLPDTHMAIIEDRIYHKQIASSMLDSANLRRNAHVDNIQAVEAAAKSIVAYEMGAV